MAVSVVIVFILFMIVTCVELASKR